MSTPAATGLAITNPLVKYRALVATKEILPDQAQLRLALHLQKLYDRLKDYEPQVEYSTRLDQISRAVNQHRTTASPHADLPPPRPSTWRTLRGAKARRDTLALTRSLTSHESALQLNSPKGLMLHGEVGTGKSMLVDLFADCLPTRKKRRWHFNTFMLETFAKLESLRRSRRLYHHSLLAGAVDEDDYSLLWLAKDMVQTSPILFLDEFQMPDRVASKILSNLMTSFFHLGGVLVATSNRMPEELAKAAGMDFSLPAPSRWESLGSRFGVRRRSSSEKMFAGHNEFAAFLDVLKARCEVWEMNGASDYRRLESSQAAAPKRAEDGVHAELRGGERDDLQRSGRTAEPPEEAQEKSAANTENADEMKGLPAFYAATSAEGERNVSLDATLSRATGQADVDHIPWSSSAIKVYGRTIPVPRTYGGVTMWTFDELCKATFGPADYISLASSYHTLILTEVPVLTWLMKNEARRFITLLDALYECKCKLGIQAAIGPDDLFFPDKASDAGDENGDSVYSETISEVYQDATAPFRPNILMDNPNYAEPDAEPDYTHARLAGLLNADTLEDEPPNKHRQEPFRRSYGRTDSEMKRGPIDSEEPKPAALGRSVDFGKTSAFTGEDERFAYKRAQSRLWEMCGARWWSREEPGWHQPLPQEVRRWENTVAEQSDLLLEHAQQHVVGAAPASDVQMSGSAVDDTRPKESFKHAASPFRTSPEPPPKFSWTHIWGTMKWGPKAGAWGQGPEDLKNRRSGNR